MKGRGKESTAFKSSVSGIHMGRSLSDSHALNISTTTSSLAVGPTPRPPMASILPVVIFLAVALGLMAVSFMFVRKGPNQT